MELSGLNSQFITKEYEANTKSNKWSEEHLKDFSGVFNLRGKF